MVKLAESAFYADGFDTDCEEVLGVLSIAYEDLERLANQLWVEDEEEAVVYNAKASRDIDMAKRYVTDAIKKVETSRAANREYIQNGRYDDNFNF